MHHLIIISLMFVTSTWCDCESPEPNGDKKLPALNDQFEATVIITHSAFNSSLEMVEYYDHVHKKGALYFTRSGKKSTVLYDFSQSSTSKSFYIKDGVCTTGDMAEATMQYFIPVDINQGRISQISDIIKDAANKSAYVDQTTIRGIETDRWSSCLTDDGTDFMVNFYFTRTGYTSAGVSSDVPVPVRIEAGPPINTIYDFALYKPGPISDHSVFEVPHGYVCDGGDESTHPLPHTADAFSAHMEWVKPGTTSISNTFCAFDYNKKLSRHDLVPQKEEPTSQYNVFGMRPISVIHDFSTGLEYLIDESQGNCNIRAINMTKPELDDYSVSTGEVAMRHGYQLFHFDDMDFHYQGHRVWRGIDCDVWSALKVNYTEDGVNYTMEAYFAQPQWNVTAGSDEPDLLGYWISSTNGSGFETVRQVHVYDYTPTSPDPNLFNIRLCYNYYDDVIHAMFRLEGSYIELVSRKSHEIAPVVWNMIAEKCQVPHLRIADIYFDASSQENTDVWFTLLNIPGVEGAKVEDPIEQIDMSVAFANLREAIKSGITFTVPYDSGDRDISVKKDSLVTNQHAFDPRIQPTHVSVMKSGHGNGAMAGLGIGMFFIGLIAGVVLLVLWRRRHARHHGSIPYSRDIDDF